MYLKISHARLMHVTIHLGKSCRTSRPRLGVPTGKTGPTRMYSSTRLILFFLCLVVLGVGSVQAQRKDLVCTLEVTTQGNLTRANLSFELFRLNNLDEPEGIGIRYQVVHPTKGIIYEEPLNLAQQKFSKLNNTFYTTFQPKGIVSDDLMLRVTVTDQRDGMEGTCQVRLNRPNAKVSFLLRNLTEPNRLNYLLQEDSLAFVGMEGDAVFLVKFNDRFLPATPPMGGSTVATSAALTVDSVWQVPTNVPMQLQQQGLYLAQSDTSTANGIGFRVEADFPKFKKFENVLKAMIYLSTDTEIEGMRNASDGRGAFDNFWLNAGGTVEVAQNLVREFFQRVAYSNEFYTDYKQGWKTDKGMIHIVMGEPDRIEKTADVERWIYQPSAYRRGALFEFEKRANIFTGYHYTLRRSSEYRRVWMEAVELWRKGQI